jgi:hypothetical protein
LATAVKVVWRAVAGLTGDVLIVRVRAFVKFEPVPGDNDSYAVVVRGKRVGHFTL